MKKKNLDGWGEVGRYGVKWFQRDDMGGLNTGKFFGEYRHSVDDKGRLTIPSHWRPELDSEANNFLALASLTERSVTVYPPKMIDQLYERFSQISMGDQKGQRAIRRIMATAHNFSCDKQGRINLNDKLIQYAGLKKSVVLLGEASKFMIYDEAFYDELTQDEANIDDLADIAKDFGF
ncbi:MAG: division/cell wall cluster transcriptional repressor MraZ [Verrucomicrobia bacterium]|nr:division/cell wall cluster transcriptional repressor MraZ [Verrucomicrobiota bacterium]